MPTLSELKDFIGGSVWAHMKEDLKERRQELLERLGKGKDEELSDDRIRGRIDSMLYIEQVYLPTLIAEVQEETSIQENTSEKEIEENA